MSASGYVLESCAAGIVRTPIGFLTGDFAVKSSSKSRSRENERCTPGKIRQACTARFLCAAPLSTASPERTSTYVR
jgi:hypothetical protein